MEGMFRVLQPDIMGYAGALAIALVIFVAFTLTSKKMLAAHSCTDDEAKTIYGFGRLVALVILILTLCVAGYRVATYSAVNRVPRNAVDGSEVYDRMKKNAEPTAPAQR